MGLFHYPASDDDALRTQYQCIVHQRLGDIMGNTFPYRVVNTDVFPGNASTFFNRRAGNETFKTIAVIRADAFEAIIIDPADFDMPHFGMGKPFEYMVPLYESGTNPRADCDVHGGINVSARSEAEFPETGGIHICIHSNRHAEHPLQFIEQRETFPAGFRGILYRSISFASVVEVNGTEGPDTKCVNRVLAEKFSGFRQCLFRSSCFDYTSVYRFIEFIQHRTDELGSACLYGTYQHLGHS